jgi:NDP-sugar pyrophosphorylase family protein
MSPRVLPLIPPGERGLVADQWEPILRQNLEEIGWLLHPGPFADLGRPGDFLRASLEALDRGGAFPAGSGDFDAASRVLALRPPAGFEARRSVIGTASIGNGAAVADSVVWKGVEIGAGAQIRGCLAAGGRVPSGERHENVLLWHSENGVAAPYPLS